MKPFDQSTYLTEVLKPFVGTPDLPGLFERYCLSADDNDDPAIEARLKEVKQFWDKKSENNKYGEIIRVLSQKHGEAALTLADASERAKAAAEAGAQAAQQAAEAKRALEAWERTLREIVKSRGGLDPSRRSQLEATAKRAGISDAHAKSLLDAAPVAAPPAVLSEQRRREIKTALAALAQGLASPRAGLSLFHALGLEGVTYDGARIQDAHDSATADNKGRSHGLIQNMYATVLTQAKRTLLEEDPRAYVEGLILDVREQMEMEGMQAAASGGQIDELEAEQLAVRAMELGLPKDLARRVVVEIARANDVPLTFGGEVSYVPCPSCNQPHRRSDNHEHCTNCGAQLFITCPREGCGARNEAVAARCTSCNADLRGYADAVRLVQGAGKLLREGRVQQASDDLHAAQRTLGDSAEVAEQLRAATSRMEQARSAWKQVEAAMASRRVYAARQALRELKQVAIDVPGPDGASAADRLRAATDRIASAEAALAEARTKTGHEREAALARVLAVAADSAEARQELDRIPPAPPRAVDVQSDDRGVVVRWEASPTVGVQYRLTRTSVAGVAASVVATTESLSAEDTAVEAGARVRYAVTALRGSATSPDVASDPVVVLKEVTDLSASDGDGQVTLRWNPPGAAGRVTLLRREEGGAERSLVPDPSGYVDRDVRNGRRYSYVVRVEYPGLDGSPVLTGGRTVYGQPAARSEAVTLTAEVRAGELWLSYAPPPAGTVTVLRCDEAPELEAGTDLDAGALTQYGKPLPGEAASARDTDTSAGVRWYLPVSVSGGTGVVGPALRHLTLPVIEHVNAVTVGPLVRVTWEWPDGVRMATVVWRRDRQPSSSDDPQAERQHVRFAQYHDQGGFTIEAGRSEPVFLVVFPAARMDGEIVTGGVAPKSARAAVRPVAKTDVRYSVRQVGRFRKKALEVEVTEPAGNVPRLVFVARPGDILPNGAGDGQVIGRFGGEGPCHDSVDLAGMRRPMAVRMFLDSNSAEASHELFHPSSDDLRIK